MLNIPFTKMQGAGNDFIVVDNRELRIPLTLFAKLAKQACARHVSLGADGLMVADWPEHGGDLKLTFFNGDGSLSEMCGNGARCIGRFGYERFAQKERITIEATSGDVYAWRLNEREYRICLNEPTRLETDFPLLLDGAIINCAYVELGDPGLPHAVLLRDDLEGMDYRAELFDLARKLRNHAQFPKGANINFCQVLAPDHLLIRTYERGVEDFTLACGTGSASAVTALQAIGKLARGPVRVSNPGDDLIVEPVWAGDKVTELFVTGPTNMVADGTLTDEDIELE